MRARLHKRLNESMVKVGRKVFRRTARLGDRERRLKIKTPAFGRFIGSSRILKLLVGENRFDELKRAVISHGKNEAAVSNAHTLFIERMHARFHDLSQLEIQTHENKTLSFMETMWKRGVAANTNGGSHHVSEESPTYTLLFPDSTSTSMGECKIIWKGPHYTVLYKIKPGILHAAQEVIPYLKQLPREKGTEYAHVAIHGEVPADMVKGIMRLQKSNAVKDYERKYRKKIKEWE